MKIISYLFLCAICFLPTAQAKQFEIFDGQFYNGLYYPMVDIIEWGEANGELPHIEFHIHSKDKPFDVSVVPGDKNGKPVLWVMYDLKFRGERICRHVLAPAHFKEGMKLYTYRDNSDGDYDNIYFSSEPMKETATVKSYAMPTYEPCTDELASNKPDNSRKPSSQPATNANPSSAAPSAPANPGKEGKNIGVDYENNAVPFSF
jgi:hypothetical protein